MTICNPSVETKPIPVCTGTLTIGTIPDLNQAVKIFIEDITTGRIEKYDATSSGAGVVTVDLTDAEVSDKHTYQLHIEKTGTQNIYAITVGGEADQYYALHFFSAMDDGECFEMAAVTLERA